MTADVIIEFTKLQKISSCRGCVKFRHWFNQDDNLSLSSCLFHGSVCHTTPYSFTGYFYEHTKQEQITLEESPAGRSVSNVLKGYVTSSAMCYLYNYITKKMA